MKAMIVASLAAAALVLAAPAAADPEGDYLNTLANSPGFTINGFTSPLLVGAGNAICGDLRGGTPIDVAQQHAMAYPGATNFGVKVMVGAAQQYLCPDTLH